MNKLQVRKVIQYGTKVIYPACETSKTLAKIANTRTLTDNTILLLKSIGYTFEVKAERLGL